MNNPEYFEAKSTLNFEVSPDDADSIVTYAARLLIEADRASEVVRRIMQSGHYKVSGTQERTARATAKVKEYQTKQKELQRLFNLAKMILTTLLPQEQEDYWSERIEQEKHRLLKR